MDSPALEPGRLLTGRQLDRVLTDPDRVFRSGTWDRANLTSSGYYARLSGKPLVIPAAGGQYKSIAEADEALSGFTLRPGESAVVATLECFSLDLDILVTIGQRFGQAAKGLLMLHGSVAHPGYGRAKGDDGSWAIDDKITRLYFVVANVGPGDLDFSRGEKIAYLQFFSVERDEQQPEVPSKGYEYLKDKLYGDARDAGGLSFFRSLRDTQDQVHMLLRGQEALLEEIDRKASAVGQAIEGDYATYQAKLDGRLDSFEVRVGAAERTSTNASNATNNVVVFGVYLIAVAILGVLAQSLASTISEADGSLQDWRDVVIVAVAALFGLSTIGGLIATILGVRRVAKDSLPPAAQEGAGSKPAGTDGGVGSPGK